MNNLIHQHLFLGSKGGVTPYSLYVTDTPRAVWGLTRMIARYSGIAIKIKNLTTGLTNDFYFNELDRLNIGEIETFLNGSRGKVLQLYDQTGNGWHLISLTSTVAPSISNSIGVVNTDVNGNIFISNEITSNEYLRTINNVTGNTTSPTIITYRGYNNISIEKDPGRYWDYFTHSSATAAQNSIVLISPTTQYSASKSGLSDVPRIITSLVDKANLLSSLRINGSQEASITIPNQNFRGTTGHYFIGADPAGTPILNHIYGVALWNNILAGTALTNNEAVFNERYNTY